MPRDHPETGTPGIIQGLPELPTIQAETAPQDRGFGKWKTKAFLKDSYESQALEPGYSKRTWMIEK
ncbi:hypothetical protein E4U42_004228 [Claviceps africana]|uniref:Uncharacterized protein n=1 Tax=Claviceps africana TaxID=83212 RepID=A0A8K0NI89_9HYPO|nr:hypothetical protein E4U42_004228 [Claviceps africana]